MHIHMTIVRPGLFLQREGPGSEPGNSLVCPDEAACSVCGVLGMNQCRAHAKALLDDRGVIHFYLNLYKGGANVYYSDPFDYDYDRDEEAGAALLRMIERSLSPVRPDL